MTEELSSVNPLPILFFSFVVHKLEMQKEMFFLKEDKLRSVLYTFLSWLSTTILQLRDLVEVKANDDVPAPPEQEQTVKNDDDDIVFVDSGKDFTCNTVMWFGKYKGQRLGTIPWSYFVWMENNGILDYEAVSYVNLKKYYLLHHKHYRRLLLDRIRGNSHKS